MFEDVRLDHRSVDWTELVESVDSGKEGKGITPGYSERRPLDIFLYSTYANVQQRQRH